MQNVDRLLAYFIPDNYQLSLSIDQQERTFRGTVTIHGTAMQTSFIRLHAKDLSISSVTLDGKEAAFTQENDELTITHTAIQPSNHIFVVTFNGQITEAMHGLYPCRYEHNGQRKELLATQFESHHVREVFPCIDEPEAKATFDLTLTTVDPNVTVLGNMPIKSQKAENNRLVTTFDTTPRMSTYLLAWVIGELQHVSARTNNGVEVRIWATPAQSPESLTFALDTATRTIDFFDDYFGVPYPLPKADHVALPDFSSGAMENWGLITYREVALLADPTSISISSKQYIALVIAHELSHQWFGNLVTMKWWNNLWLNESFATLMEYIAVDALFPDWNIWLEFSNTENILALRRDSLEGVQPVQVDVHHPDEISTLFDGAIVYAKGARLLRMLHHYIGHDAFRTGLKIYFEQHAYQNTSQDDLWETFSTASGKDIASFMTPWISQPGYPVVEISQDNSLLHLTQQQFFIGPHTVSSQLWPIPLNATNAALPQIFDAAHAVFTVSAAATTRLNAGDTAHFITKYNEPILTRVLSELPQLAPLDRLQFLHEQTLLARAGYSSTASLIPTLLAYRQETHQAVWDIIALASGELRKFVENDAESEAALRRLYAILARPLYQQLGWQPQANEPETDSKRRALIISMMLYSEEPDVVAKALEIFQASPLERLDPELRSLIISAAVRHSQASDLLTQLTNAYKATSNAELRQDIASGLTASRGTSKIETLLSYLKDTSIIRKQDVRQWFVWIIQNRYGREHAWQWLRRNWSWIAQNFGSDKSYDDFPRYASLALVTPAQLQEYKDFFTPLKTEPALTRVIEMGIRDIEARVKLINRDGPEVKQALAKL